MAALEAQRETSRINRRVRAILLTRDGHVMFIKRVKPHKPQPYWVAPGGGVEDEDSDLHATLARELYEELGATADVIDYGFVLRHQKANKNLEEHFFICRLREYDLNLRHGPEFDNPAQGMYIPDKIALTPEAISALHIKTGALRDWLLQHLDMLRDCARAQ